VLPSPKSQEYVYGDLPPLELPEKLTDRGAWPDVGEPLAEAVSGDAFSWTVIVRESVVVALVESVTERVTVYVPDGKYGMDFVQKRIDHRQSSMNRNRVKCHR